MIARGFGKASHARWCVLFLVFKGIAPPVAAEERPPAPPAHLSDRVAELECRLRSMEAANHALIEQLDAARRANDAQLRLLMEQVAELRHRLDGEPGPTIAPTAAPASGPIDAPDTSSPAGSTRMGGTSFEATPESLVPGYTITTAPPEERFPLRGSFGLGFEFLSENEEFMLQVHLESQLDYRAFDPTGQESYRSGFVMPRNRIFFTGRITRPVEYMFSINRGFGNLDLLDSWLNFRTDDRLQFKLGRMMTPFNYEQLSIQNMWLITPERSLFTANLGLNRQLGGMLWGTVLERRLDYALGVFAGPRNSYEDFNEDKDVMAYLNTRPFQGTAEDRLLRGLNLGGSFAYGAQDNPLVPRAFRTATNASNAGTADRFGPPFFVFNEGVIERGQRTFWSAHLAYFYRQLSVFADYNGAILRYARGPMARESAVLPAHGSSIAAGYFLTGETVERRTIVDPRRPFNLSRGEFGLGAIELVSRYSTFNLDEGVFAAGLSDPALWTNRVWISNLGLNWYPNRYIKVYLDWQHSEFSDPVLLAPGRMQRTNELFWVRCQFYF